MKKFVVILMTTLLLVSMLVGCAAMELADNGDYAEEETAALEAEPEAALPQPVSAMAETAEAARAAFRKLRREIMFRFFIVVNSFPGAGGKIKRPAPFAGRVLKQNDPVPVCYPQGQDR